MLGFDPTMIPFKADNGSIQYTIDVTSAGGATETYRTTSILFDGGSDVLFGHGTRVWKAVKLDSLGHPSGQPVALKDSWVDGYREREGDISSRIRESSLSLSHDDRTCLNELLLTVVGHGDVRTFGSADCTRHIFINDDEEPTAAAELNAKSHHAGKVHYRIVFAEIGKPLHEETSLRAIYGALEGACIGTSYASMPYEYFADRARPRSPLPPPMRMDSWRRQFK